MKNNNDNPEVFASQVSKILSYMLEGHTITPLEALDKFGSMRLSAVIKQIEKRIGYPPLRKRVKVKNRFGKDVYVAMYWLDADIQGILCHRVDELENIYREIRELLLQNDYPVSPDWIHSIAQNGADGLQEVIIKDTENEAKRLKVPFRIAEQWKRTAIQEVPREVWGKCDSIRSKIISLSDGS